MANSNLKYFQKGAWFLIVTTVIVAGLTMKCFGHIAERVGKNSSTGSISNKDKVLFLSTFGYILNQGNF